MFYALGFFNCRAITASGARGSYFPWLYQNFV